MNSSGAKRASIALGIFMAIVLAGGAVLQIFSSNSTVTTTNPVNPTTAPVPTFAPPPTDYATTMTFDNLYLHPSGIFTIAQPAGWNTIEPNQDNALVQVNMRNTAFFSVIDAYIENPIQALTLEDLSGYLTSDSLGASWANFSTWRETNRRTEGDALLIDFAVTYQRQQYVARQKVWTDGNLLYSVRILMPDNAVDYLRFMLDNVAPTLQVLPQFAETPYSWDAHYDPMSSHIIRYPEGWAVTDTAPGRPTSISGTNGEVLRVQSIAGQTISDESAAQTFIENFRSGAVVSSVSPVTRGEVSGFAVAYTFRTADGDSESGYAVLLNGADQLHLADLRFRAANIDLNTIGQFVAAPVGVVEAGAEATAEATEEATVEVVPTPVVEDLSMVYGDYRLVLDMFYVIDPPLRLLSAITPTPLPTLAPVSETTAEATDEATDAVEADATEEADEATEPEAEPTEEATEASE